MKNLSNNTELVRIFNELPIEKQKAIIERAKANEQKANERKAFNKVRTETAKALENRTFSLNQIVKFVTKGDGKAVFKDYLSTRKNLILADITVSNIVANLTDKQRFKTRKNPATGKFEPTTEKREKFTYSMLLSACDRLNKALEK